MNLLAVDFLRLRRAVGVLGVLLVPLLIALAGLQPSISAYYDTGARDVFVIALGSVALLLAAYRGYDRGDRICSAVASVALFGVALVPVSGPLPMLHYAAAVTFFGASAVLAWRFGFGGYRVRTFRALAGVIVLALVAGAAGAPLLLVESAAVVAFGGAWLAKGRLFGVPQQ